MPLVGRVWSYKLEQEVWLTSEAAEYPAGLCEAWAEQWLTWLKICGFEFVSEQQGQDLHLRLSNMQNPEA